MGNQHIGSDRQRTKGQKDSKQGKGVQNWQRTKGQRDSKNNCIYGGGGGTNLATYKGMEGFEK